MSYKQRNGYRTDATCTHFTLDSVESETPCRLHANYKNGGQLYVALLREMKRNGYLVGRRSTTMFRGNEKY